MESVLACLPRGSRLAILRLRSLGDCVLTTPALEILKQLRPDLRVVMVVEDRFRPVFENNSDVDEILPPEPFAIRRWRPALCLNLHGGSRSAWMTAFSGARFRAGFGHFRPGSLYNVRIPRAQQILNVDRTVHTAEHLASAVLYMAAARVEIPRAKLSAGPVPEGLPANYAVFHPAASTPEKTWRADGFLAIAEHLKSAGLEPVFIGGAGDNLSPFRHYRVISGAPLPKVKSLLSRASLFVGNDSGPAHIAAAFGAPCVVIFGASDPAIWGPWRTASEIVAAPDGIAAVTVTRVLEALARLGAPV
jgi:heptosyltransferase III